MLKENFINDIDIVIPNITYIDAMVIEPITLEEEMELAKQQMIASAKAKAWIKIKKCTFSKTYIQY